MLLRGAGDADHIPRHEPRLARAAALADGLPEPPSSEQLLHLSENWKPDRTWVTLLLRPQLEDHTGEIASHRTYRRIRRHDPGREAGPPSPA